MAVITVVTEQTATQALMSVLVTLPELPTKGYFKKGDSGQQIKYLKMFLKWYGVYNGKVDGSFGPDTETAVIAYQIAEILSKDGWFGPKCLARAKTVKK